MRALGADPDVHGILVQLPLARARRRRRPVLEAIPPAKDVDGFHPENAGRLRARAARASCPRRRAASCGCCSTRQIPLTGRHAVVLGRSHIVGRPAGDAAVAEGHAT